jgi:hypothetical protein
VIRRPTTLRVITYRTANPAPWAAWNRYPGQIIGFVLRMGRCRVLSITWARPTTTIGDWR